MIKKIKKYRGYTLIELLIYIGLLMGFLIVLTDIFAAIMDVKLESNAVSSVEADSRYILTRLAYDIPQSTSITTPGSLGATSNSLIMVISGVTYTYSLSSSNLQLSNNLGANNLNSSESTVSDLSFQKIGNPGGKETIKLSFTVTSNTIRSTGPETRTFSATIGRR